MKHLGLWSPGLRRFFWKICKTVWPSCFMLNVRSLKQIRYNTWYNEFQQVEIEFVIALVIACCYVFIRNSVPYVKNLVCYRYKLFPHSKAVLCALSRVLLLQILKLMYHTFWITSAIYFQLTKYCSILPILMLLMVLEKNQSPMIELDI